ANFVGFFVGENSGEGTAPAAIAENSHGIRAFGETVENDFIPGDAGRIDFGDAFLKGASGVDDDGKIQFFRDLKLGAEGEFLEGNFAFGGFGILAEMEAVESGFSEGDGRRGGLEKG